MSLRPIKSRKARHQARVHLKGRVREEWKPFQSWHWNDARKKGLELLGRKTFVLGLIGLAIAISFTTMYRDSSNPLFHSYICTPTAFETKNHLPCGDPSQLFWVDNGFQNSGGEFQTLNSQAVANCQGSGFNCFELSSSSTQPALALTKQPIDLSTAASHELTAYFEYCFVTSPSNLNNRWGMYFTTNGTIPAGTSSNGYSPKTDTSVVFALEVQDTGSGNINAYSWLQKETTKTLQSGDISGGVQGSGTLFLSGSGTQPTGICSNIVQQNQVFLTLNYTGATPSTNGVASKLYVSGDPIIGSSTLSQPLQPWFNLQAAKYFVGFYMLSCSGCSTIAFPGQAAASANEAIGRQDPPPSVAVAKPPNIDTGGFFGPVINALINIGIYIMNGILSFIAFLRPSIISAFSFLQTIYVQVLDVLGNLLGFGNVGTDIQTLIGNVINFFTQQVPTIFANTGALFTRFFDVNSVYFLWLPTALNIAITIVTLAINSIAFVLTIIDFSFRLISGVYLIILLTLFLVYTGDDSLGGILGFLETTQWLILGPLGWLCQILNFALDLVTYLVGLIPKPFIQMVAHSIPRIPIINTSARFVNPSFDLAALRNGNMLAVWAWFLDFTFLAWYNGVTPALPGSLGALLPGMPASTFTALRGFLPMLEICLIVVSALAFIIWPVNKMFSMISLDLDVLDFDMSPGRKLSSGGLGGIKLKGAKKHFQVGLAKKLDKKKEERIERETRKVVSVEEEKKITEQTARLKEEHERLKKLEERNK